jgi:hypothetical protein
MDTGSTKLAVIIAGKGDLCAVKYPISPPIAPPNKAIEIMELAVR